MTKTETLVQKSGLSKMEKNALMALPESAPDGIGGSYSLRRMAYDVAMQGRQPLPSEEVAKLRALGIIK